MLIKTITEKDAAGAVRFVRYENDENKGTVEHELWIAPVEYEDALVKKVAEEAAKWYVHTTYIMDYESSTDAGDGRDDYCKEEKDIEISLEACIVKDGEFSGVLCRAFDRENYVLITEPKVCISHPRNYSGRGYHSYRDMYFELLRK